MTYRLGELAELVGGTVEGDEGLAIDGVAALDLAGERELSFLTNRSYLEVARRSEAGALLVPPGVEGVSPNLLAVANPYLALAEILEVLHPPRAVEPGVDATARIHAGAKLAENVAIGPFCSVGEGSVIESGVVLHPNVVVGRDCHLGPGCVLHPMVVLYEGTILGSEVVLHSGVIIGADGFGYAQSASGHRKVPQIGRVVIEDRVEIGASSTVDRAALHETRVGEGTKIDNLVMVAHNVEIGSDCLLIAQVGVAGSAKLGDRVVLAGQTGVAGHVDVGDDVQVASKSAVFKPAKAGSRLAGIPATDSMTWRRQQVRLRRLKDLERRLATLEKRLESAEGE